MDERLEMRQLRERLELFRQLVENSQGLVCTHDLEGNLLYVSPASALELGYAPGDGVGRNLREFLAEDKRPLFDDYLRRINEHGQDTGLMRVVSRSGAERMAGSWDCSPARCSPIAATTITSTASRHGTRRPSGRRFGRTVATRAPSSSPR